MFEWPRLVAGAVLACSIATASCNAVLGIEEATAEARKTCEIGDGLTLDQCTTGNQEGCERCVSNACGSSKVDSCLQDQECRLALTNYRLCQRDDCTDPGSGSCAGCLQDGAGADCFATCTDECRGSEIVSLCEIFCSCMGTNCAGIVDPTVCMNDCRSANKPWRTNCLLSHCERATATALNDHCAHASDLLQACEDEPPTPDPDCDPSKRQVGYVCDSPDECCSGFCQSGTCRLQ